MVEKKRFGGDGKVDQKPLEVRQRLTEIKFEVGSRIDR